MNQLLIINPENVSEEEVKSYTTREAARAIVLDENNLVALLHVAKEHYYKLPGGGLEGSEDPKVALLRECLEEIGCDVEILSEVGSIIEYRKMYKLKQISYCYLARLKGEKGTPNYTDSELAQEFKQIWLPYEEALKVICECKALSIEGSAYIVPRDKAFLERAKDQIT